MICMVLYVGKEGNWNRRRNYMMTDQKYKDLSIKEFTKAAEIYDSDHAGIYEMCKDDYPPVLEELKQYAFE